MNASELRSTLDEIRSLSLRMASIPEDQRIVAFRAVDSLFLRLEGYLGNHPQPGVSELLDEVKMHAIALARLEETAEEPDSYYCGRIASLVEEMGAVLCR